MNLTWIKLAIDILDDAKIKIIRSHPDGNSIVVLWIGLLCLAMKSARPGIIEISDGIPYTIDDLSSAFNIEKKTVELGLALFAKYRMIDLFDGNTIEVINFARHQSLEEIQKKRELNRQRQKDFREKRKCNALLTCDSQKVTPQIRIDKIREEKKREYPDWLPVNTFLEYQNQRKKKVKDESLTRFFKSLRKICDETNVTPEEILNQSIVNGWEGIFPLKDKKNNIISRHKPKDDFRTCKQCGTRRWKDDLDENGICVGRCENATAAV